MYHKVKAITDRRTGKRYPFPRTITTTDLTGEDIFIAVHREWVKDYKLLELIKHKHVDVGTLMLTNEYTEYNDIMAARNLPTLTNIQYKRIKKYMGGTHE